MAAAAVHLIVPPSDTIMELELKLKADAMNFGTAITQGVIPQGGLVSTVYITNIATTALQCIKPPNHLQRHMIWFHLLP